MNCPCGNRRTYAECCEIAHKSIDVVITAEQLMRSRYTAFTMANGDYLMQSHHLTTRPINEKESIMAWAKSVEWLELKILSKSKGLEKDSKGSVKFKAYYKEDGIKKSINENSSFVKENDCWFYLGLA